MSYNKRGSKGVVIMKKILIGLVAVVVIAVTANFLFPSVNSLADLKRIDYRDSFSQKESEYYVYFYQESCPLCLQFSPELVAAYNDNGAPIYVVDMAADQNVGAWYDWDAHKKQYTKVIGKVENGVQVFNQGESSAKYPSNEGWVISVKDNNEIVAYNDTPMNNRLPQSAEEIQVSGTPALLKIKDGKFAGYAEGVAEARQLLGTYKK